MRELSDAQLRAAGVAEESCVRADYVRIGATLPGVEEFAGDFFGYPPREVRMIDPQQRIFLEACWEALEFAGHPPRPDGPLVGVFAGSYAGTYSAAMLAMAIAKRGLAEAVDDIDLTVGGEPDFLTSRVAYKLGLRGPAVSVQTACSSSLYAVHYATLSLLSGECDIALAGGATVLEPVRGYRYHPGGNCPRTATAAPSTPRQPGRLTAPVSASWRYADCPTRSPTATRSSRCCAVPRSATTAPIRRASPRRARRVSPTLWAPHCGWPTCPANLLRYVEAHGSGVDSGRPRRARRAHHGAARDHGRGAGFCGLGSVKANIGHTGPASSIAGFIKAVHVARTGSIPPHPTFESAPRPGTAGTESLLYADFRVGLRRCRAARAGQLDGFRRHERRGRSCPAACAGASGRPAQDRVRLVAVRPHPQRTRRVVQALADGLERGDLDVADVATRCGSAGTASTNGGW